MNSIDKMLNGQIETCHFPFLWLSGVETEDDVRLSVDRIYKMGAKACCVEPRNFKDFDEKWWPLIDAILDQAQKNNMRVMVVDEDWRVPTGHARGVVMKPENRELRRKSLVEYHTDVLGPRNIDLVVGQTSPYSAQWYEEKDQLIGAFAYKRTDYDEGIDVSNPIDLTANIKDNILTWKVPEGFWRIVYVFKTLMYSSEVVKDPMVDFINADSVELLVKEMYEDYERRYGHLFGNTFMGFFSDEPAIGNHYTFDGQLGRAPYNLSKLGIPFQSLAWTDELKAILDKDFGFDCAKYLPALWYWDEKISPLIRPKYMNALTTLYRQNFVKKIGAWCQERGLYYVGHVLEDNDLHCRPGQGPGHYFRSQQGQSCPGIDIVMDQIFPGYVDFKMRGPTRLGKLDFYHYILAKLNSSAAHTYPEFKGTAFCEVSIGYGWAEGSQTFKYLMDYLLVRGNNRFVTGAIRPKIDDVHAPHFGSNDNDEPQFEGACKIFDYANKATMLLRGTHVANAAILYHAQAEWSNKGESEYMYNQDVAKALYDNHIDFDILCEDLLDNIYVKNSKIAVYTAQYDAIVVPYAKYLPEELLDKLIALNEKGANVIFVNQKPINCKYKFKSVELSKLAKLFKKNGWVDVKYDGSRFLRHMHLQNAENDVYMFVNEDPINPIVDKVWTGIKGNCNVYDLMGNNFYSYESDGYLPINLACTESVIFVYEKDRGFAKYEDYHSFNAISIEGKAKVELFDYNDMEKMVESYEQDEMVAVSKHYPTFSGKIVYTGSFKANKCESAVLEFERVGENAELIVNGVNCGLRPSAPFAYNVTNAIVDGENEYQLIVRTTLANSRRDYISMYIPLEPTGATGKVTLYTK